jgi:hypothetical protein
MTDAAHKPHAQGVAADIPAADRELFDRLDRQKLYEYIFMQVKNIWRVDGLYFLGIEKRHDMQEATDVDAECWRYMGKAEARELKKFLGIDEPDPAQVLWLLRHTSWAVSHELKSFAVLPDGSSQFAVDQCRTQLIRLDKGLDPHPCRQVREGYLQAFAKECNPRVRVETISCPPERTTDEVWCRWVFRWA